MYANSLTQPFDANDDVATLVAKAREHMTNTGASADEAFNHTGLYTSLVNTYPSTFLGEEAGRQYILNNPDVVAKAAASSRLKTQAERLDDTSLDDNPVSRQWS